MMELATSQEFSENLAYKHTSLEKTIIYPTEKRLMPGGLEYLTFFMLLSGGLTTQLILNSKGEKYILIQISNDKYEFQSPNTSGGYSWSLYTSAINAQQPPVFNAEKAAGIFEYDIDEVAKKLKITMTQPGNKLPKL
jgi:hypothetical protein